MANSIQPVRKRAAEYWAVLLSGLTSSSQADEIQEWQQSKVEQQNEFDKTGDLLARIDQLANHPQMKAIIDADAPIKQEFTEAGRFGFRRWHTAFGAAALVLIAVAFVFPDVQQLFRSEVSGQLDRYVTRIGERKTVVLQDGSKVNLNTATEILVNYNDNMRRVRLERGEAYFEVKSDADRPFMVNLDGYAVSVLGTSFNLRKNPSNFTLAVEEGTVLLHRQEEQPTPNAPVIDSGINDFSETRKLSQYRVSEGIVAKVDTIGSTFVANRQNTFIGYSDWRTGILQFQDERLSAVVRELNRYMGKKILIEDASIMSLSVYAAIDLEQLPQALTDFEQVLPVKVEHYYDRIVMSARESE